MDTLKQLEGLAQSTDDQSQAAIAAETPPDPNAPPAPPPEPSAAEQAADMVNMFAGFVTAYAPDAADIWTEQARAASAAVLAPVLEKYGISMARIPPELTALVVLGPLLWQTSKIVAAKMDGNKAAKARPATQSDPAAPSDDIAPGPARHPQMDLYKV